MIPELQGWVQLTVLFSEVVVGALSLEQLLEAGNWLWVLGELFHPGLFSTSGLCEQAALLRSMSPP